MSSNTLQRIKGFHQFKGSNVIPSFGSFIPFGTDANLVDVFSSLDLEEELIFGGQKQSSLNIEETSEGTFITSIIQKYKDGEGNVSYTKRTLIKETPNYDLIEAKDSNSVIGHTNGTQANIVIGSFTGKKNIIIDMFLYNGQYLSTDQIETLVNERATTEEEKEEIREELQDSFTLVHRKEILISNNKITERFKSLDEQEGI